jgi:large subunit ribosomal protein L16
MRVWLIKTITVKIKIFFIQNINYMALFPKKTKFRKAQKGKVSKLPAVRGITLDKGGYALIALEPGRINVKQLEAARVALNRKIKKYGPMWIRVFPNVPVTKKPAEMRMGQGKGPVEYWIFRLRTNRIIFEIGHQIPRTIALAGLRCASFKLNVKTAILEATA